MDAYFNSGEKIHELLPHPEEWTEPDHPGQDRVGQSTSEPLTRIEFLPEVHLHLFLRSSLRSFLASKDNTRYQQLHGLTKLLIIVKEARIVVLVELVS